MIRAILTVVCAIAAVIIVADAALKTTLAVPDMMEQAETMGEAE